MEEEKEETISPITEKIRFSNNIFLLGVEQYENGDYFDAIESFKTSLNDTTLLTRNITKRKVLFHIYKCYVKLDDYDNSRKTLLKITDMIKNEKFNSFELGLVRLNDFLKNDEKEGLDDAYMLFQENLTINQKDPDAWYYSGFCKILKGKNPSADFKMTLLLKPEYKNIHAIEKFDKIKETIEKP